MSVPTQFVIVSDSTGHVWGSAYPKYEADLIAEMSESDYVEKVGREEWARRAEPCLRGYCEHRRSAR